jgi:hydroxymethylglutaryl-CoA reductase (NADPH)
MQTEKDEKEKILERLERSEIKLYQIGELSGDENLATEIRRAFLERKYSIKLEKIAEHIIDFNDANNRNIENAVGAVQVPLGFVEIQVNGEYLNDLKPLFLATTEGRLVAGINRGASAINKSGGATTRIIKSSMTRSVILEFDSVKDTLNAISYISSEEGKEVISDAFKEKSKRISLNNIETFTQGRLLFIRYSADTQAAMGMNMLTIASTYATEKMVEKLREKGIEARFISESGNMCTDKKPSSINLIEGRGVSIVAEALIKKEILESYFKVDARSIEKLNYAKNHIGSTLAGAAHNAHAANVLAATFIAYGQDVAQIVDGSIAVVDAEARGEDLYISVYIPALEVGTYGGGTRRETAKELLIASGVYGEGDETGVSKYMLAELIASGVLAGELNLLAAEAGKELSTAHAALKRG